MSLSLLKQQLAELLDPPRPIAPGLPTGLDALDEALPGRGLPRGRLTEVVGPSGSGKTTLVRGMVERVAADGGWIAYVDAARTLDPRDWAHLGERQGVWMIRPREASRAPWCADVLLRSGAFALVVLDGAPPLSRQTCVRLTRLARETTAALLVLGDGPGGATMLGGALRLRVEGRYPRGRSRHVEGQRALGARRSALGETDCPIAERRAVRTLVVTLEKGGTYRTVEVECGIAVARRLCTHPEVPDRRGVARGAPGGGRVPTSGHAGTAGARAAGAAPPPRALRTAIARARGA
ncbi:MAG TPA: ATP-binding cassette domain-containing protein [Gemmatimonadaceae bacterium]